MFNYNKYNIWTDRKNAKHPVPHNIVNMQIELELLSNENTELKSKITSLKKHCTAIPASKSLNPPKQINESNFAFWGIECDE